MRSRITAYNDYLAQGTTYSLGFSYDEVTGEHIPDSDDSGANDESDTHNEESVDSYSDGGGSLGSDFYNSDGELAGFRD